MQVEVNSCPACGEPGQLVVYPSLGIVRCPVCTLVYLTRHNDRKTTWDFYQEYAVKAGSHMIPPRNLDEAADSRLRRQEFAKMVVRKARASGRLLDVGGGWGGFAMEARFLGFDSAVLELSQVSTAWCREHLKIPAVCGWIDEVELEQSSYDLVTGIHSFEHLDRLRSGMERIKGILKPGGFVAGIVPNFASAASRALLTSWGWLDAECHYQHFEPLSLLKVMTGFGFLPIHLETRTGDYHAEDVQRASGISNLEVVNAAGLGEEIWFVFRKPLS